jgi:DNA-binding LytR/AlgR family response regulator
MDIIIIEDDLHFSEWLKRILEVDLGYNVLAVLDNVEEGIEQIKFQKPSVVISDVHLKGKKIGIDLINPLKELSIPLILISEDTSEANYQKIINECEVIFLVKPFHKYSLDSAIKKYCHHSNNIELEKSILLNSGSVSNVVALDEIKWFESERNYTSIITNKRKIVVRSSFTKVLEAFDPKSVVRVHKSFATPVKQIKLVNFHKSIVDIGGKELPMGRSYRALLKSIFGNKQSNVKVISY